MAAKKAAKKQSKKTKKPPKAANVVLSWEDDPMSVPGAAPIQRPVPNLSDTRLAVRIEGPKPPPKIYQRGTKEFRFWAAAEALRRAADFWGGIVPGSLTWEIGNQLPIHLDQGVDLNAFYTRGGGGDPAGLSFFHDTVNGVTYFSGESPEVSCHELGHAVLDALRPELWDVAFIEAPAFHESYADMSAILSVLQLQSMRIYLISATGGKIARNSRVSRLAEQLGFAIRQNHPDSVDADSLRNAANTFFYRDPQQLPPSAPANLLSSEPHSFSRVFTAAFLEILAGVFTLQGAPGSEQQLLDATKIAGQLLAGAVSAAPVVPAYYSQVAAHFLSVDAAQFNKKYRDVIKGAFVRRGILSLDAVSSGVTDAQIKSTAKAAAAAAARTDRRVQTLAVPAQRFGLDSLLVAAPASAPRFAVAPAAPSIGPLETPSRETAAQSFVEDLFRRGRVEMHDHGDPNTRVSQPGTRKTHELVASPQGIELKRRLFDCGFDAGR
ncbi:MAG TPA: hypothetical protein VG323_23280 [Thermoanaerobaculia bacterium]|nr:hypothetical protein [Thermoanaerobaculia bacterium]